MDFITGSNYTSGIDVSHHNGTVNWADVASSGVKFAYLKCSEGTSFSDPQFVSNVQGCIDNGIKWGAYHYSDMPISSFDLSDADSEAQWFVQCLDNAGYGYGDLMPVLDHEYPDTTTSGENITGQEFLEWAKEFINEFYNETGRRILFYTGDNIINDWKIGSSSNPNILQESPMNVPLWLAAYKEYGTTSLSQLSEPYGGWNDATVWQYDYEGSISGVSGSVDLDHGPYPLDWITPPSTPTGLTATAGTSQVNLSWNQNPEVDIQGYYLYMNNASSPVEGWTAITETTYTVTGLTGGTSYSFTVQALDEYGDVSGQSSSASATPTSPPPSSSSTPSSSSSSGGGGGPGSGPSPGGGATGSPSEPGNVDIQIEEVSYIGGSNSSGEWWVDFTSVDVDQDIAVQQTDARFDIWIRGRYVNGVWEWPITTPKAGQDVVFYNASGDREFGGILLNVKEYEEMPDTMRYACQCGDYTKWFDRHLVNSTYQEGITAQALISDIVTSNVNTPNNTRTFTTNNVQQFPSMTLPILQFVYIPPSQVLGQLVQMLGWGFYIDFYRDVNFFEFQYFTSPLPNNTLDADDLFNTPYSGSSIYPDWVDLMLGADVSQLKNRVFITGIYVADQALYTDTKTGDGTTTVFTLSYQPPNDVSNITVEVGGTFYQIALDLVDGSPTGPSEPQTAYVNFSNQTVRFGTAPESGVPIIITYYPMMQTVVMQEDTQAQAYMAAIDGTDGIYEYNRMDPSLSAELPTLAQTRADMTLNKYAMPHITGSFTSYLSGWRVGQYFTFQSQRRYQGEYDGSQFFVTHVQKKLVKTAPGGDWTWQYLINFSNTPYEF